MCDSSRAWVFAAISGWLASANAGSIGCLGPDTDLIESRILDSLQIVEFILFLEEESGRSILDENLDPKTLRTPESIYKCYFEVRT
jgi:acyl carrier protein